MQIRYFDRINGLHKMGYIGMCGPKDSFSAVLVVNGVSILADFGHLGHSKKEMVFVL